MPLVNIGRDVIASALTGDGDYNVMNNTNASIGVGDSTAAYVATQTDLQASTGTTASQRLGMETTGYPIRSTNSVDYRSLYGTTEANFAWQEWGVFNSTSGNEMLCRKQESLGTKTTAQSWQFTATVTFNIGTT